MGEVLLRIDDRLLHGQVLLGWATSFRPHTIVLADDAIATDPDQSALYTSLGEDDYEVRIETLSGTVACVGEDGRTNARILVVVRTPEDALRLLELGLAVSQVNVGGLHYSEGKKRLMDYVFLSSADARDLLAILERGVRLEARDLPGSRGVELEARRLRSVWH